ncbi:patatin-like phospholipase family protein [Burkholderia ubonensis]|uniref:patatin-like phospholipase family protein n=1 Tax=Burkholderia ubonensis TaxID=101571 RepID=UPI0007595CA3|nr:patatin-like phospholipase family protein [Burkholderia ubonensis]KVQ15195.1 alpha/beta hydrolase [Burkholderia ubonensis]KVZ00048.1 alpha/beta hydrolase [Burkholderia ubonensis]KWC49408.1 alpha/beta hydrolase [Burkholderia ubonensis]
MSPDSIPSTAFVFAGGGSLGAIEVGMLRELIASGERPDCVIGASAGAINAAYFAGRPDAQGVAMLAALWCKIRRQDIMPLSMRGLLAMILRSRPHLVEADAFRLLLETHLPYRRIEQAALPLHIVATDVLTGAEVVLSAGPVVDAVQASAAIPGVFPPVRIGGVELVDGGVANNTPISVAVALGVERIVVLPAGFACALHAPPRSAIAHATHALTLVIARQLVRDLEQYAARARIHVVPPLCPLDVSSYDYTQCAQLIDQAAHRTRQWIDGGGLSDHTIPGALREHHHTSAALRASQI